MRGSHRGSQPTGLAGCCWTCWVLLDVLGAVGSAAGKGSAQRPMHQAAVRGGAEQAGGEGVRRGRQTWHGPRPPWRGVAQSWRPRRCHSTLERGHSASELNSAQSGTLKLGGDSAECGPGVGGTSRSVGQVFTRVLAVLYRKILEPIYIEVSNMERAVILLDLTKIRLVLID